ncbi:MAG: UMP kinase [Chitinispirillaceae bacterium]|nr:UMP kinase [Chitinispirillaceae bacterium]
MTGARKRFRRVLLKLSGEALAGKAGHGIDPVTCRSIAAEIAVVRKHGTEIGIVIGGGNFMRGASAVSIERVTADTMGMLATVMNSLALAHFLQLAGCPSRVLTAVAIDGACEYYTPARAREYLAARMVVIIAGGTGNPFFTTDTAAALRSAEIGAEVLFKATKVDGIYDSDPVKNPKARKLKRITHAEALSRGLRVMDATAFSFCMENGIPIAVFRLLEKGGLQKSIDGHTTGSIVTTGGR